MLIHVKSSKSFGCVCFYVTDVHARFVHVFCERAAAGQTPQTAPDAQVTDTTHRAFSSTSDKMIATACWIWVQGGFNSLDVSVGSGQRRTSAWGTSPSSPGRSRRSASRELLSLDYREETLLMEG